MSSNLALPWVCWDTLGSSLWFGLVFFFFYNIKKLKKKVIKMMSASSTSNSLPWPLVPTSPTFPFNRDLPYPLYFSVHDCRSSSISFLTLLSSRIYLCTLSHPLYATDIFSLQSFLGLEFRVKHTVRWLIVFNCHHKAYSCVWWSLLFWKFMPQMLLVHVFILKIPTCVM